MDRTRYAIVEVGQDAISEDEWAAGWHFCWDWDLMLIGPGMPEMESCTCKPPDPTTPGQR